MNSMIVSLYNPEIWLLLVKMLPFLDPFDHHLRTEKSGTMQCMLCLVVSLLQEIPGISQMGF